MTAAFVLLVIYQLKHFLADYPLQTPAMLGKFSDDPKVWVPALTAHAGVHAVFTFAVSLVCCWHWYQGPTHAWCRYEWVGCVAPLFLTAFDFTVHFTMDRIKASPKLMGRWKALSAGEFKNLEYLRGAWARKVAETNLLADFKDQLEFEAKYEVARRRNTFFWWALGFDQMVHHLTHYAIIACLLVLM